MENVIVSMTHSEWERQKREARQEGYDEGVTKGYWNCAYFLEYEGGGVIHAPKVSNEDLKRLMNLRDLVRIGRKSLFEEQAV